MNLSKTEEEAMQALNGIHVKNAWANAAAFVVLPIEACGSVQVFKRGSVKIAYSRSNDVLRCDMFVWDCSTGRIQHGFAEGAGYDLATAAFCKMLFDGFTFDCEINRGWKYQLEDRGYLVIQAL